MRRISRQIMCGGVAVGGGAPVVIQSMTNTDTRDIKATSEQIRRLEEAGCGISDIEIQNKTLLDSLFDSTREDKA